MIRLDRLLPAAVVSCWLGASFVAVNVALSLVSATPLLGWLPKTVAGTGYLEDNRQRVATATAEFAESSGPSSPRLVAVVGISNVREAVTLSELSAAAGPRWRFLGLGGAGLTMGDVARHADVILTSDLKPDVVVLGFGLHQLVDTRPKPSAIQVGFRDYLKRGDLRNAAIEVRAVIWVYARAQDLSLFIDSTILDLRDWLFRTLHTRVPDPAPGHRSPWREMIKSDWPEHFSARTLKEEEQFFEGLGTFDAETYRRSPNATAVLVDLIRRFRERQASVILLLMPERSTLQQRIPADALDLLKTRLEQAFPGNVPPFIDDRGSLDDDGFVDLGHPNRRGSVQFSRLLGTQLRDQLSRVPK